jgi:arylsulfatase
MGIINNKTAGSPKHIVLIMCDQLRSDAVGFMGNEHVHTPNLDRLASGGAVMENMFVQSLCSCMPSRASILTGRYPQTNRMSNGCPLLDPRETTLPETLQRAGYRTGMFGKLHLTPQLYTHDQLDSHYPILDASVFLEPAGILPIPDNLFKHNYGFQENVGYEDILAGEYLAWVKERNPAFAATLPDDNLWQSWEGWDQPFAGSDFKLTDAGPTQIPLELHPTTFIAESASDFFQKNHAKAPCFMHVSFVEPHHPFNPPAKIACKYDPEKIPLPQYMDTGNVQWPPLLCKRMEDFGNIIKENTQKIIAWYYAMIETVDLAIGKLLDTIERAGEMNNTLFVFMADHGELLGDNGMFRKGSFHYDSLMHVPCFFTGPGIKPLQHILGMIQAIDITPTILGYVGLPITQGIQGNNYSMELLNQKPIGREWVYSESNLLPKGPFVNCWTVRTEMAKLNYYPNDSIGHLFDLEKDPGENHDVFNVPEYNQLRDEMIATLLKEKCNQIDPLPKVISQY